MYNYDIEPSPVQILFSDEQIRAYANPTRITILSLLAQEKASVSGIARQLGVHPANLTHHFKLLEQVGLIKLVEKRDTGKNMEKYYRAKAYTYTVEASNRPVDQKLLALSILRDNLTGALQTLTNGVDEREVLGILKSVRLQPDDVPRFGQKLLDLAEEFTNHAATTGTVYSLNISLYPTVADYAPAREVIMRTDQKPAD